MNASLRNARLMLPFRILENKFCVAEASEASETGRADNVVELSSSK